MFALKVLIPPFAVALLLATLRVPGAESDDESKTPSASPRHGRSRPSSIAQESSSESEDGDSRGEVRYPYGQVRRKGKTLLRTTDLLWSEDLHPL